MVGLAGLSFLRVLGDPRQKRGDASVDAWVLPLAAANSCEVGKKIVIEFDIQVDFLPHETIPTCVHLPSLTTIGPVWRD
jgi:hypothetical protein